MSSLKRFIWLLLTFVTFLSTYPYFEPLINDECSHYLSSISFLFSIIMYLSVKWSLILLGVVSRRLRNFVERESTRYRPLSSFFTLLDYKHGMSDHEFTSSRPGITELRVYKLVTYHQGANRLPLCKF